MKFENLIKVLRQDGTFISLHEWQKTYGLPVDSEYIGKHFKYTEYRFMQDLQQFNELVVCSLLMKVLDGFRVKAARPVKINSFNRTEAYQKSLSERGFKTATTSPHVVKLAADIDTDTPEQTRREAKILLDLGKSTGMAIRVGYEQYLKAGQTFIHVDVCPEFYGAGKVWHDKPHPKAWEQIINW